VTSPPLWSFASASRPSRGKPVSFAEAVKAVWRWAAGRQPKPTLRERIAEERLIERLAEELAEAATPQAPAPRKRKRS
jgi:hypothetical protein